jgi:hypothetical protein
VDGGGGLAGEFGEAFGGPSGRRDQLDLRLLGAGEGATIAATVKLLPQPGAAGQDGDLRGQGEADRVALGEVGAGAGAQPSECRWPVGVGKRRHPVLPAGQQLLQAAGEGGFGAVERHQEHRGPRPAGGVQLLDDHAQ